MYCFVLKTITVCDIICSRKADSVISIYRVDKAASSADETGSCSSDESFRTAVALSHPAVIIKSNTLINVQSETVFSALIYGRFYL